MNALLKDACDPMLSHPAVVRRVARGTADTFTWTLDVGRPWPFVPGQFNMMYLFGIGEVAISISGDPDEPHLLVHTIRAVGSVTTAMQKLGRHATVGVRGPFGIGWPIAEARGLDVVVVAGGLGMAPLRPVVYRMLRHRQDYGRCTLLYGGRTPADLLYARELERWRSHLDLDLDVTVDRGEGSWRGHVGVVPSLLRFVDMDPARTIAMICGPEVMMRFTVRDLQKLGVPDSSIYLSMERNMKCGVGFCGHCQFGPGFVCKDGPVYRYDQIASYFVVREI